MMASGNVTQLPSSNNKRSRGQELTSKTISTPLSAYMCLQIHADSGLPSDLDNLIVHSYLVSAFTQLLGITGAAISFDILKVKKDICWIRVAREDATAVVAAISSWHGALSDQGRLGWIVRAKGNWLSSLIPQEEPTVWDD